MDPLPADQPNGIFRTFGWIVYGLSIIAFLISLPFIILAGLGLIATVPLFFFIKVHRQYMRAIKSNIPLSPAQYKSYIYLALPCGLVSGFGFFAMWDTSGGITDAEPRVPYLFFMAFLGAPIITVAIVFAAHQWNARFNKPQST
jgi:hypothetical protein